MKNTFLSAIIALFIGATVNAQSTVDSIAAKYKLLPMPAPLTVEKTFPVLGSYQLASGTPGAVSAPATTAPATTTAPTATDSNASQTAPVTAQAPATVATEATPSVTITLDSVNKGIVWIDGLPEGKFKAYLKKSPTTYRIVSQKTNLGKEIPEGTLYYDVQANALNIALGKPYNEEDPTAVFAVNAPSTEVAATSTASTKSKSAKQKTKVTFYTASKVITEPATSTEAQGGGTDHDQQ
ncbi:hypothetical protein [Flavisolibacter tropicus]|uniref:Uncharacterized protein n=1 Tax=Flavisolibacter tropicus TaxID=1492898 RepID=A0A172TTU5_9BACT|nr:hypothetical protein [Flavisolibacter tropicus]ANE50422.1 hypothetical protein SY85_07865 [Flavisolibacter tropicus]